MATPIQNIDYSLFIIIFQYHVLIYKHRRKWNKAAIKHA